VLTNAEDLKDWKELNEEGLALLGTLGGLTFGILALTLNDLNPRRL
jgi:hypothetical protein